MFTIGIIGKNGQLGRELIRRSPGSELTVAAFGRDKCDIADADGVERTLQTNSLDLVVNAAAYTAVDQAEEDAARAYAVNAEGPGNLAAFCSRHGIPLIHISTDYVFDGKQTIPYRESDAVSPLGIYGESKARGEQNVREQLAAHIIIRTAWLYSAVGRNFVKTMLRLGREKTILKVVDDQYGCPTSAADLADAVWQIILRVRRNRQPCWGTYHFCNRGETTWFGFAQAVFTRARQYSAYSLQVKQLMPITTADYPTPAKRPAFSVLNCDLIQKTFSIPIRPWQAALQDTLEDLFRLTSEG
jgi:dTDP-4-dehydrorhamnose reductase